MFFSRGVKYLYYFEKGRKKTDTIGTVKYYIRGNRALLTLTLKKMPFQYPQGGKISFSLDNKKVWERWIFVEQEEYREEFEVILQQEPSGELVGFVIDFKNEGVAGEENIRYRQPEVFKGDLEAADTKKDKPIKEEPQYPIIKLPYKEIGQTSFYVLAPEDLKNINEEMCYYEKNSFLLHGCFNYKHIVVGPIRVAGEEFQIGVPGNYYQKEEVVAEMFGFPLFQALEGEKKTAAFGYYFTQDDKKGEKK